MPRPLHGRTAELAELHRLAGLARSGSPQLVVLFGRRRVGKTFLLRRFLEQLDPAETAYHGCTYLSADEEMRTLLAEPAIASRVDTLLASETFAEGLARLADAAADRLLVVAIDEMPYLLGGDDHVVAAIQQLWDRMVEKPTKLLLILTGSSISTMTRVVSSRGALFARPTKLMQLQPFDFPTSASFLGIDSESPPEQRRAVLEARAACGGYPLLLDRWDVNASADQNLRTMAGGPLDPLIAMSSVLLLDLPDARGVRSVLTAIGRGVHKHGEIQSRADQRIDAALSTLTAGGFVRSVQPIGSKEQKGARKLYRIADEHLRFYFAIVDPYRQLFEADQGVAVLAGSQARWATLVQAMFESDARDHAVRLTREGAFGAPLVVGEWWLSNRQQQTQIDVVGIDPMSGSWRLAGEVKWVARFGANDLRHLDEAFRLAGPVAVGAERRIWVPSPDVVTIPSGMTVRVHTLADFFAP